MRRTALVLIAALAAGASAGFFVHNGKARAPAVTPAPAAAPAVLRSAGGKARAEAAPKPAVVRGPATISIPRLHLRSRVFAASKLELGPAWWPVTGRPGGGDTVAIAGHRTTHTHPFYYLEWLRPGDAVYVRYDGRVHRYRVRRSRVVPSTDLHIADAVGYERLLLSACTPRGSAAFRLVVEALPS